MHDTQWSRYLVFLQPAPAQPHECVGSVHAPDGELALQNARDVYTRRPHCVSLWVAPVAAVFTRTRQELADWQPLPESGAAQPYYIFTKSKSAGTQTLLGELSAPGPQAALQLALQHYATQPEPFEWWVVPAAAVLCSDPAEAESFFSPALDKPFRQSSYYKVLEVMRQARRQLDEADPHD